MVRDEGVPDAGGQLLRGVAGDGVVELFGFPVARFELAVVEAGDGDGGIAFPLGDGEAAVGGPFDGFADADQVVLFGDAEAEFVGGPVAEGIDGGVPTVAGADGEVAAAGIAEDAVALVGDFNLVGGAFAEGFREDDVEGGVGLARLLDEGDFLAVEGGAGDAEGGQQAPLGDAFAGDEGGEAGAGGGGEVFVVLDGGVNAGVIGVEEALAGVGAASSVVLSVMRWDQ